tara:strand:+ start:622 stop:846 length:225 start_codon:yes stop_codon:yes gene_type:complete
MTIEDLRAAYKMAYDTPDGATVLEDLGLRFHMRSSTYVPDSNEAAFREGQRSVMLFIHNMLAEPIDREDTAEDE